MKFSIVTVSLAFSVAALPTVDPPPTVILPPAVNPPPAANPLPAANTLPAVDPTKPFALQITANKKTLFLPKGISGYGVPDVKNAESCVLNAATELVCGGKTIGVGLSSHVDMAPIKAAPATNAITKGFSMDAQGSLHWGGPELLKIDAFKKAVTEAPDIYSNGEAKFGFFEMAGKTSLYFQLGCPGSDGKYNTPGTHSVMGMGVHNPVITGVNKAVPL